MPKFGLGKGAEALFTMGDAAVLENDKRSEILIPLDKIESNPDQPRKNFDETSLLELSNSIREHGVIEPIIVEKTDSGTYRIIAGERRWRASHTAGLSSIPALIRSYSPDERYIISLIENIQRADLNPIEEALAYKQLMENANLSQDEAAERVGKNRSTLANSLRLLKLPPKMQESIASGGISSGHARALLSVEDKGACEKLFAEIIAESLSVREAEKRAAQLNGDFGHNEGGKQSGINVIDIKPQTRDPELAAMRQRFIEKTGTKVTINGDLQKGCIHIEYYSADDLDRINEILSS